MITENKLKVLCLCRGGIVRSVAFKRYLVTNYDDVDVLAAGGQTIQMDETRKMLMNWAQLIFILSESSYKKLRKDYPEYSDKMVFVPVGTDIWGDPSHPNLIKLIETQFSELADTEIKRLRKLI